MNTKTLLFILAPILLVPFFISCGVCSKKIDCPGYKDDTLDSWFPYQNNQQLVFRNDNNEADTFNLKITEITEPYQLTTGPLAGPKSCMEWKRLAGTRPSTPKENIVVINLNTQDGKWRTVDFSIGNHGFDIYDLQGNGLGQIRSGSRALLPQAQAIANVGGTPFYNVIEAIGDTAGDKTPGIYKLYYKQGAGVVAYSEYPSLQTWIKQ